VWGSKVFQALANLGRTVPVLRSLRAIVPAVALAFGAMAAAPSQAATVVLTNGFMDHARSLTISGIGTVNATPVQFDGYYDVPGPNPHFTNIVAFCVDVYHTIKMGNYDPDLVFQDTVPLTHDSNPNAAQRKTLTNDQILQIGALVNYGTRVFYQAPKTTQALKDARWDQLAAVQGAIWEVVSGKNVTSSKTSLNNLITNLSSANYRNHFNASYGYVPTKITLWTPKAPYAYPHYKGPQAFAVGSVPEPATWVMMIGGFAFAGAMVRRSRRRPVPVTVRH
jgi:hypothetical protein